MTGILEQGSHTFGYGENQPDAPQIAAAKAFRAEREAIDQRHKAAQAALHREYLAALSELDNEFDALFRDCAIRFGMRRV